MLLLKAASVIFAFEIEQELTTERQKSVVDTLKGLIAQSEEIYGEEATRHLISNAQTIQRR